MRKRIIGWLVLVPLCAIIFIFALANRHMVSVNFNPLVAVANDMPGFGIPLFLIVYAALFLGIALGGIAVWWTQGAHRCAEKRLAKENARLKAELDTARRTPARDPDPALAAADELI